MREIEEGLRGAGERKNRRAKRREQLVGGTQLTGDASLQSFMVLLQSCCLLHLLFAHHQGTC